MIHPLNIHIWSLLCQTPLLRYHRMLNNLRHKDQNVLSKQRFQQNVQNFQFEQFRNNWIIIINYSTQIFSPIWIIYLTYIGYLRNYGKSRISPVELFKRASGMWRKPSNRSAIKFYGSEFCDWTVWARLHIHIEKLPRTNRTQKCFD